MKRFALDIDNTIANFNKHVLKYFNVEDKSNATIYDDERILSLRSKFCGNVDFFMSMPVIEKPNWEYEPEYYLTARNLPEEVSREWLIKNNFPDRPVINTGGFSNKALFIEGIQNLYNLNKIDIFIDDYEKVFFDINSYFTDIKCYLFTRPYNKNIKTDLRIKSLNKFINTELIYI